QRLYENCLLVADCIRDQVQIFEREQEVLCKGAVVGYDPEDLAALAMGFQTAFAKGADRAEPECTASNVNFTGNASAEPALSSSLRNTSNVIDVSDEFVAGSAAKAVIASEDFHVGIANAGEKHPNQRPAGRKRS